MCISCVTLDKPLPVELEREGLLYLGPQFSLHYSLPNSHCGPALHLVWQIRVKTATASLPVRCLHSQLVLRN